MAPVDERTIGEDGDGYVDVESREAHSPGPIDSANSHVGLNALAYQRPKALTVNVDGIPDELRCLPQWVGWGYELRGDKWSKPPLQPSGEYAQTTNPRTWNILGTVLSAIEKAPHRFSGVGFVFSDNDAFVGIDLDHCFAPDGKLLPWAGKVVGKFRTYCEYSISQCGLHLICRGRLPEEFLRGKGTGRRKGQVEVYNTGRYFCTSGVAYPGTPREIADCTPQLAELLGTIATPDEKKSLGTIHFKPLNNAAELVAACSHQELNGHSRTDDQIIAKAQASKYSERFNRLWSGDTSEYRSDHSAADLALCSMLGFYCGPDELRIDGLFRQSGLVRAKWTDRPEYRRDTIAKALSGSRKFYKWTGQRGRNGKPKKPAADASNLWITENRTDAAAARGLVARFGQDLMYVDPWDGKWLHWDGKRWASDRTRIIEALAKELAAEIWSSVQLAIERKVEAKLIDELIRYAKSRNSANGIRNTITLARSEPGIAILPEALDREQWKLNCENGTLDLRAGKLGPHDRADYITKLAPVTFDPDADCPTWRKFLMDIFAGQETLIGFVRRLVGYTLTGRVGEHVLPVLYGTGSNGKSTLCTAILDLMGEDYAIQGASDLLLVKKGESHPTERADLHGKRLVACIETDEGRRLAEGLLKQITGGDKIRARRMREDFWQFSATHKIWLACNHKPVIRGTDHGIWRRIKLVPFNVVISDKDQDKELGDKLAAERSGILNWAMLGCLQWQAEGLNDTDEVKAATGDYRNEMDVLGEFLTQQCYIEASASVGASDLYKAYREWADAGGEYPLNQTRFGAQLTERGFPAEKQTNGRIKRCGLGLILGGSDSSDTSDSLSY